jgi:glycerophosphoryl diester phosphodiesterase
MPQSIPLSGLLADFRQRWRGFLAVHIFINLIVAVVLMPLLALLLNVVVRLAGQYALADTALLMFVLSPAGLACTLILGGVVAGLFMLEQAALFVALRLPPDRVLKGLLFNLSFLAHKQWALGVLGFHIVWRCLIVVGAAALAIGGLHFWLLSDHDINFHLHHRTGDFQLALLLAGLILLAAAIALFRMLSSWIFALPLLIRGEGTPRQVMKVSAQCVADSRRQVNRGLASWLAFALASSALSSLVVWLAGMALLPGPDDGVRQVLVSLTGLVVLYLAANLAASWLVASALCLLVERLFRGVYLALAPSELELRFARVAQGPAEPSRVVALVVGLMMLGLVSLLGSDLLIGQSGMLRPVEVIAHRGDSRRAPENTFAAIESAIGAGSDWVEIDVQSTLDGDIVLAHDRDLERVAGDGLVVEQSALGDMQGLDIGSWFDPRFSSERLPRLEDVLRRYGDEVGLLIEVKTWSDDARVVAERVVESIDRAGGAPRRFKLMSLNWSVVEHIRRLRPSWTVGLLATVAVGDLARMDVQFLAVNARAATRRLIREARSRGMRVFAWCVNDPVGMTTMISRGVDGIITDEPAKLADAVAHHRSLDPASQLVIQLADFFDRPAWYADQ